jgi:hypothetical protein
MAHKQLLKVIVDVSWRRKAHTSRTDGKIQSFGYLLILQVLQLLQTDHCPKFWRKSSNCCRDPLSNLGALAVNTLGREVRKECHR